jgi:DNA-binding transcriptional MocR family regulator
MTSSTKEAAQTELFNAETTWFHIFRTMIANGDTAKMGPHAFTVYAVIKAHTNFSTGRAFPSLELIAEKSGISVAQIKRELKTLEEMGYVTKEKRGRSNLYQLREKVEIQDQHGRPQAVATWDYLPSGVQAAIADLKNVMVSGDLNGARVVHIERLVVNMNTGSGTQINLDMASMKDTALKRQLESLLAKATRQADVGITGDEN